jgi:hypothetical protein
LGSRIASVHVRNLEESTYCDLASTSFVIVMELRLARRR